LEGISSIMRWTGFRGRAWKGQANLSPHLGRWIEAAFVLVLVVQLARLIWALMAPIGVFGDWRAREPVMIAPQARQALFSAFDPFYRSAAASGDTVQQVTSLPLQLFGIRINEGSGQGSAIIADESGVQSAYSVGDEIAPGVVLKAVTYDHVVISRGGATENLFIDQSGGAAPDGAPGGPPPPSGAGQPPSPGLGGTVPMPGSAATGPLSALAIGTDVGFAPRTENGRVTGVTVSAVGGSDTLGKAGFRSGDIVVQVNGRPISSQTDINNLQAAILPGARLSLMVERGSATVPIALILPDKK
jgi:general secretion pathway protein C